MTPQKVSAVIFDFDMTLADSSWAIHRCTNLLAKEFGLKEVSREKVMEAIGLPIEGCWRLFWGDFRPEWLAFYRAKFRGEEQNGIKPFPNAVPLLEKLRAAGVKTGVVSNRTFARKVIDATGLSPYMDAVVGMEDVKNPKPKPDALYLGIERLGSSAGGTLYVGDTDIDMQTSVAAGVRGVGMTTGNFGAPALKEAGAWRTCGDLIEVAALSGLK